MNGRDLRAQLVALTERDDEPRLATVAEHLVRALESFDLAAREQPSDSTDLRRGLMHARLEALRVAQSVLACHEADRRRRAR